MTTYSQKRYEEICGVRQKPATWFCSKHPQAMLIRVHQKGSFSTHCPVCRHAQIKRATSHAQVIADLSAKPLTRDLRWRRRRTAS